MKLHLGCGKKFIPGFIHIDIKDYDHVDYKNHDIRTLKMFDNDTVDEIYICHVLEHFSRKETTSLLSEYARVLKKEGKIRISVPDFDAIVSVYNKERNLSSVLGLLYGGRRDSYDFHNIVFNFDSLKNILEQLGFSNVERYDTWSFLGEDLDDYSKAYIPHMDRNGTLMSLNIIASKSKG
jgi:predicted SAM-dependent methyltransferase